MEINHNHVFREVFNKQHHEHMREEAAKARLLRKAQLQENRAGKKELGRVKFRNLYSRLIGGLKEIAIWFRRMTEVGTGSRSSH